METSGDILKVKTSFSQIIYCGNNMKKFLHGLHFLFV